MGKHLNYRSNVDSPNEEYFALVLEENEYIKGILCEAMKIYGVAGFRYEKCKPVDVVINL